MGRILQQNILFVNTLHKKSFLSLGRLTRCRKWNIMAPVSKGVHEWGESTPFVTVFLYFEEISIFIVEFNNRIWYHILIRTGRRCGAENAFRKQVAV